MAQQLNIHRPITTRRESIMKRAALSVLTVLSVMLPITALSGGVAHADATVDPNAVVATVQSTVTSLGVPIQIPALPVSPVGVPALPALPTP